MKAEVIARLMVTASEGKWEDKTPAERKRYNEKHPNNPHADTYDPKDEWWEFMTPEMRQRYIREHPNSKYAKEYGPGASGTGVRERNAPAPTHKSAPRPDSTIHHRAERPSRAGPPGGGVAPYSPRDSKAAQAMATLPRALQEFVANGETSPGSESRSHAGGQLKAGSGTLAKSILHDVPGALEKMGLLQQLVGENADGDARDKVEALIEELLNTSSMREAIEKLGPAGALLFTALQFLGADRLWAIAHAALSGLEP
ncbi:hypothetical protein P2K78_13420, partial [Enterococcus faecium]|nr:hypothetical protein [Enterococcus faecium]